MHSSFSKLNKPSRWSEKAKRSTTSHSSRLRGSSTNSASTMGTTFQFQPTSFNDYGIPSSFQSTCGPPMSPSYSQMGAFQPQYSTLFPAPPYMAQQQTGTSPPSSPRQAAPEQSSNSMLSAYYQAAYQQQQYAQQLSALSAQQQQQQQMQFDNKTPSIPNSLMAAFQSYSQPTQAQQQQQQEYAQSMYQQQQLLEQLYQQYPPTGQGQSLSTGGFPNVYISNSTPQQQFEGSSQSPYGGGQQSCNFSGYPSY